MRCLICDDTLTAYDLDVEVCNSCLNQIYLSNQPNVTDIMLTDVDHLNERCTPNAWAKERREAETYEQTLYEQALYRDKRGV